MYIGNTPFQGLVGGGNILDASIEGVDLSTSAIAARLGYTPVDPGAAVFSANPTISSGVANGVAYLNGSKVVNTSANLTFSGQSLSVTNNGAAVSGSVALSIFGGNNMAFSAASNGEGYTVNAQSAKYPYYQAGTVASFNANANGVDSGLLIDLNAYNSGGGATNVYFGAVAGAAGNGPANFVIGRRTGTTSWAESLRVDTSGNVGIGTNTPSSALYVKRTTGNSGIYTDYNGTNIGRIEAASNGNLYIGITTGSGDIGIGNTANATLMNLTSTGKIGVGTAAPVETLTVVGNIKTGYEPATGIVLGLTNSVPNNNVNAYILWGSDAVFGGVNGDLIYIPRSSATASHRFYTGTGGLATEKFRIGNNGNVGIGTTDPRNLLQVGAIYRPDSGTNSIAKLVVSGAGSDTITHRFVTSTSIFRINDSNSSANLQFGIGSSGAYSYGSWIQASYDNNASTSITGSEGTEHLHLQPIGGHVIISKAVPSVSVAGHTLGAGGYTYHTYDGGNVMWLNRLSSNGDIQIWQQGSTDKLAAGTYNGSPYIGGGTGATSAGFMFNGASIEPTYNGGANRNDAGVDFGSQNYRWKRGYFTNFCIGTTTAPPGNGLVVGGPINAVGGIVSDTVIHGTIASNFTGQRWLLLDTITSGSGLLLYGDFVSASYTTELITKVYIRKDYNTNAVSATLTGVGKAGTGQTCYVQTVTYGGVNYVALSTTGGDPGWNASWTGFRMNAVWNFVTSGVTVVTTHATY